jgi:hypothetical protein
MQEVTGKKNDKKPKVGHHHKHSKCHEVSIQRIQEIFIRNHMSLVGTVDGTEIFSRVKKIRKCKFAHKKHKARLY